MVFNLPYLYLLCNCTYFTVFFKYIFKFEVFCFLGNIIFFELDCRARRLMIESSVRCTDVVFVSNIVFVSNTVDTAAQLESASELVRIQISVLARLAIHNFNIKYLTDLTGKNLAEGNELHLEFHYDKQLKIITFHTARM